MSETATPKHLTTLAATVLFHFEVLAEWCPHLNQTDCAHPRREMDYMNCCPANCPLLLEEERG